VTLQNAIVNFTNSTARRYLSYTLDVIVLGLCVMLFLATGSHQIQPCSPSEQSNHRPVAPELHSFDRGALHMTPGDLLWLFFVFSRLQPVLIRGGPPPPDSRISAGETARRRLVERRPVMSRRLADGRIDW
jgi:hypothetical protein